LCLLKNRNFREGEGDLVLSYVEVRTEVGYFNEMSAFTIKIPEGG